MMTPRIAAVVPFLNALRYLEKTAPPLVRAARRRGDVEVIFVDNGSTDGSGDFLATLAPECVRVIKAPGETIAAMRNIGAAASSAAYLSFIDADCQIADDDYFDRALTALDQSGAAAVGCEYELPESPHWVEETLYTLHYMGRDRDTVYINGGNFFVQRGAFDAIGGFRGELLTDEDSDICRRLVLAGYRIREALSVRVIHLGNPKSVTAHFRRTTWHSVGMFANVGIRHIDRPTAMLALHILNTIFGLALLVSGPGSMAMRAGVALVLQLAVPVVTVAFRIKQTRRVPSLGAAVLLYWVYYWARFNALTLILRGRARHVHK